MSYVVRPSVHASKGGRRVRRDQNRYYENHDDSRRGGISKPGKPHPAAPRHRPPPEIREQPPRKVVIRNLPAQFTQEKFLQHVAPIPDYTYFAFHGPDLTLSNQARCRIYIRFKNDDDVGIFKEKFDGYVFLDGRGHELRCIVELAPYQRTATQHQEKLDAKCGHLLTSEEYLKFLEELDKKKENAHTSSSAKIQASLAVIEARTKELSSEVTTPLMEYVRTQYEENRRFINGNPQQRFAEGSSRKEGPKGRFGREFRGFEVKPSGKTPASEIPRKKIVPRPSENTNKMENNNNRKFEEPVDRRPPKSVEQVLKSSRFRDRPPFSPPARQNNAPQNNNNNPQNLNSAEKKVVDGESQIAKGDASVNNPITGVGEFVQKTETTVKNAEKPSTSQLLSSSKEEIVEGGPRVPNKSRPSQQLYQPKARRRYQN